MSKQKTYNVAWTERHSVNVKAKNSNEAIEKIHLGDYDEASEDAEMIDSPTAFEI